MTIFEESRLKFTFDENYQLIQSDDEVNFKNSKKLPGTKDVDFLGFYQNDKVFFMEVKNYRGERLPEIDKFTDTVAQKLRDTVAVIAGASRNTTHKSEFWEKLHSFIGNKEKQLIFILWLEVDTPTPNPRGKNRLQIIADKLKSKCKWLKTKLSVQNKANQTGWEFTVDFLSDAPQN